MHQLTKGKEWYGGSTAHVAIESQRYRFGTRNNKAAKARKRGKCMAHANVVHIIGVIKREYGFQ